MYYAALIARSLPFLRTEMASLYSKDTLNIKEDSAGGRARPGVANLRSLIGPVEIQKYWFCLANIVLFEEHPRTL